MVASAAELDDAALCGSLIDEAAAPTTLPIELDGVAVTVDERGAFHAAATPGVHLVRIGTTRFFTEVGAGCTDVLGVVRGDRLLSLTVLGPPAAAASTSSSAPPGAATATAPRSLRVVVRGPAGPIAGAAVFARGVGALGTTDGMGVLDVRAGGAGALDVTVAAAGFLPAVLSVAADDAGASVLEVALEPELAVLDDVVVTSPRLDVRLAEQTEERRGARQVVEVVSAEQAKRTGDQNAAQLLRRVAGLSVIGGRYVLVRGLGDRYVSTLVDDVVVPSTDPERRTVPLDLFPTALLDGVTVHKTWSPELPAEFGGGAIDVRLKQRVDHRFGQLSLGVGGLLGSTFEQASVSAGGALDPLGIDTVRGQPASLVEASAEQLIARQNPLTKRGYSAQQLEELGEDVARRWSTHRGLLWPDTSVQLVLGDRLAVPELVGGGELATVGAVMWSRSARRQPFARTQYTPGAEGALEPGDSFRVTDVTERGSLGALGSSTWTLGAGAGPQRLSLSLFVQQDGDDEARTAVGDVEDTGRGARITRLRFVERTLAVGRLAGAHALPSLGTVRPLHLRWHGALAVARRGEPDSRELRYDEDQNVDGAYLLSDRPDGNQLMSSTMWDGTADAKVVLSLPATSDVLSLTNPLDAGGLDVGLSLLHRRRAIDTRRYSFLARGPQATSEAVRKQPRADDIFTPAHIGPDGFELAETTRPTDNADADATLAAVFARFDLHLTDELLASFGARVEASHIAVRTFELFSAADEPVVAELDGLDLLPALNLSWAPSLVPLVVKGGLSRTVSRPELRELSPAVFTDVAGGRARFGNPEVRSSSITHADLRAEWALSDVDFASIALFAKLLDRPIESIVSAGADQAVTVDNVESATNLGLELELRASASLLPLGDPWSVLAPLYLAGNVALIDSHVVIGAEQAGVLTSKERPLAGQSPWLANLQLGYDDATTRTGMALSYNAMGPRILEVGALGAPDVVEQPFHQLDLVVSQGLEVAGHEVLLRGRLGNLLDPELRLTQGDRVVERSQRGRSASLTLSCSF